MMLKLRKSRYGFTLAETLITLGIIGIVAAITLPQLIGAWKDKQFKTAYKKAYSDINQAFQEAIFNQELTRDSALSEEYTAQEMDIMKNKFIMIADCLDKKIDTCWAKGETIGGQNGTGYPCNNQSTCFTDISGRNWCTYYFHENIFVVDTNGFKSPNRFGKDRWYFVPVNKNNQRSNLASEYTGIGLFIRQDAKSKTGWCHYPPCNFQSWLLD
ncbi:TPA: type II secretion system protein [Candidatus Scatenecus faecavium]|uniref:Type II secretion system protein n=1 Tax=Candidatus Scatenecus faecavium TaxID=2840915 RepID=A0A9D1FXE0_9BACT|nr:type II secretion system protein [Candidatus Scatenecus faecavium]